MAKCPESLLRSGKKFSILSLYNELCYRHALTRLANNFDLELVTKAWENYSEIFDTVINGGKANKVKVVGIKNATTLGGLTIIGL